MTRMMGPIVRKMLVMQVTNQFVNLMSMSVFHGIWYGMVSFHFGS